MASSHAHHAHPHRYPPHPNSHSNSNPNPSHVPNSDFRLPPLKSLNFQYRPLQQHDAPPTPDQPPYAGFDVSQDVNGSPLGHAAAAPSAPTTNGTSFSAFGYPTPTPTSATSAPAYVHRQPFAFQGQASSQSQQQHDHNTWRQQHPHGANPPASANSQTPSQMHAQVTPSQTSSFARTTPLVPTTVDTPSTAPARGPSAFPAPPPKHRSTYPPSSPYTPNTSHSYTPSYPPSSTSTSAPYAQYNTSPGYTTSSTSPTFGPSTSPSYASTSANAPPSYPTHNAYPTPTSAYPHPPPSPTPTPTQPPQQHSHTHSSPHYVPPPTSASTYAFDDTRPSTAYESHAPPVRGHPQVQDALDSRVPIPDRARYPHAQPKPIDARMDSRHEMYPHPSAPTSVPASAAVDARHSQSYSQHEPRPGYSNQADSSRPGTSYAQGQPPAHLPPQTQSEIARPYPPESRTSAYTQDTKYTYPQSHPPEPSARASAAYAQDHSTRVGYPPEGPTRPPHAHDSRTDYPHEQEFHGNNRGAGAPYVTETRQSSGYVSTQDTRHGYASSEASAITSSFVPAEQRHGPPAPPQFVPSNADQRSSLGDSRSAGAHSGNNESSRGGYTAHDSVSVPAVVPLPRPPPPPPPPSQHHLPRQNGQPHGYSSGLSSYPPQHAAPGYDGSPASAPSAASALSHSQSQSYIPPPQSAPHPSHSSHSSQPAHSHPSTQTVHSTHPAQTQTQTSHSLSHSQAQQHMHQPEPPRPAYVSPADTVHAREARFSMSTMVEEERERERRERERERIHEERERERELEREREREREKRERESQREREKEHERLAELREKEQRDRERDREREGVMHEVLKHCTVLYNFATRYAQLQSSTPLAQPSAEELAEMTHRAQEVVRLLESLRSPSSGKLASASTASSSLAPASAPHSSITPSAFGDRTNAHAALNASGSSSGAPIDLDTRAPKRPWEETQTSSTLPHISQLHLSNSPAGTGQGSGQTTAERSAAEKDMEIIRHKRALTTSLAAAAAAAGGTGSVAGAVGGAVGAGKSKYRKRSRATPPGKCHSCNIRETPEWRRGPDGARTLCNACGLHYAKLVRKRDKALAAEGGSGTMMRIDMEMLRASARAAENEKAARAAAANGANAGGSSASGSSGNADMDKMNVHTGSFQILSMNMNMDNESGSGQGQQGPSKTQTRTPSQQPQPQPSQPSTTQLPPPASSSGTPHLHPHGVGSGLGHPLPPSNAHYSHPSNQARTHGGPPPPPWAGKAYGQEMQHPQQSFIRTSHSVSSGASPPR